MAKTRHDFFNDSVYVVYKVESDLISKHILEIEFLAKTLILACLFFFSFALFIKVNVECALCDLLVYETVCLSIRVIIKSKGETDSD